MGLGKRGWPSQGIYIQEVHIEALKNLAALNPKTIFNYLKSSKNKYINLK